jgi:murein DD-endopeptidase MepM/ murein hydrolase activator NlpD
MKKNCYCLIICLALASSCTTHGPFYVGNPYGAPVPYGERRHPGIDFNIKTGTPVIAATDGIILYIKGSYSQNPWDGGICVGVYQFDPPFFTLYCHSEKIFVEMRQELTRGQLTGHSGSSNDGYPHLHFAVCKIQGRCENYSNTYDPSFFWLGDLPQCYEPGKDYSNYPNDRLTLPVACGAYAKTLMDK